MDGNELYGIFETNVEFSRLHGILYSGDLMLKVIENLQLTSVIKGITNPHALHVEHPDRLILRLTGVIRYKINGDTLVLGPGDALFISGTHSYCVEALSPETGTYIMVNFSARFPDTFPPVLALYGRAELTDLFTRLYQSWSVQTSANQYRCMALIYELLALFSDSGKQGADSSFPSRTEPAMEYLELHMFDPDLKINRLHTLCGVSDTYFRRLFIARFGVSPKKYVINRRLSQAKAIIDHGEFSSIGEVAALVGFDDALYFSKAFKQQYGHPPSVS